MALVPVTAMIKFACAVSLLVIMTVSAPHVVRLFWFGAAPTVVQQTMPERVTNVEDRISALEHRMDSMEAVKIDSRMAAIEARQGITLMFLAPVALFVFTHTWEIWQRIRGERRTRSTDRHR